ncbi:MAG: DUF4358 domain-containing protein [Romboutsia sp.]|uniref:DUF4358 domain-containing protein n=1 Tax=Romboutsia sp. TaxID=1965302 RepID=UPI003F2ADE75
MKKLLLLFTLVFALSAVGCSSKSEVKDVPVEDIKAVVNTEALLSQQPVSDIDAKEFYAFETVKDNIQEGFVLQAMINVRLQDVFVVKTDDVDKVMKTLEEYKTNSLQMFADGYGGDENADAVANSILASKGNYVYFIATKNAKDIEAKILEVIE